LREGQSRALNFKKLDSYLFGTGVDGTCAKAVALKELFGEEYMVGLNTLRTALKTAQREAVAPDRSNTSTARADLNDVARAYLGLFTRSGRILTAALHCGSRLRLAEQRPTILKEGKRGSKMLCYGDLSTTWCWSVLGELAVG
jgi:hypothetical protein